nr:hypothetical protein [Angustibacter aerolatus]
MGHERDYSEGVAGIVDEEVRRLIEAAHDEAWEVLVENRDVLDNLVLALLEHETLGGKEPADDLRRPAQAARAAGVALQRAPSDQRACPR